MNRVKISGVLPVILTPWDEAFDIHEDDFARQVRYCGQVGADGIVIGQVSELLRMNQRERHRITDLAVQHGKAVGSVIVSTGAESTRNAIEYSLYAQSAGADAVLLMHPVSTALTEERMHKYYSDVIRQLDIPVMVHHAKSYARIPMTIEMQARLIREFGPERVLFKPESAPLPPKHTELLAATGGTARIFEGDGGMMLIDSFHRGLAGTIPATDCVRFVVKLWDALKGQRFEEAQRIAYPLAYMMCQMMNSVDCYQSLAKHILWKKNLITYPRVREPLDYVPDARTLAEVERIVGVLDGVCNSIEETRR